MNKLNKILVVIFLFQGVLLLVNHFSKEEKVIVTRKLTDLNKAQITYLKIEGMQGFGKTDVHLQKIDGKWVLPKKFNYPVNQKNVDVLLAQILDIRLGQAVASKTASQSRLYVSDLQYRRKISWFKGKKEMGFYLGSPAGVSHSMSHVRLFGEDKVYQVEIQYQWFVGVGTRDWINPVFMDLDADEVIEFRQEKRDPFYKKDNLHVRQEGDSWELLNSAKVNDKNEAFNPISFEGYMRQQVTWDLEDIVGRGAPYPADSSLTDPPTKLTFTLKNRKTGKLRTEQILVGMRNRKTGLYYARIKGDRSDFVFSISPKKVATLALKREFFGEEYRKREQVEK